MKLINLFDGNINRGDVSDLLSNYLQPDQTNGFIDAVANKRISAVINYLLTIDKDMFFDFFDGYTEEQVTYIFMGSNKPTIVSMLSKQIAELGDDFNVSVFEHDNHYVCKDCYDDFYDETLTSESPCPTCGGRLNFVMD